jgi:predicted RNA-binding Zn-ribbon protein involved in translation (DUF1610 family)
MKHVDVKVELERLSARVPILEMERKAIVPILFADSATKSSPVVCEWCGSDEVMRCGGGWSGDRYYRCLNCGSKTSGGDDEWLGKGYCVECNYPVWDAPACPNCKAPVVC